MFLKMVSIQDLPDKVGNGDSVTPP
jgi:hypothetical protein